MAPSHKVRDFVNLGTRRGQSAFHIKAGHKGGQPHSPPVRAFQCRGSSLGGLTPAPLGGGGGWHDAMV